MKAGYYSNDKQFLRALTLYGKPVDQLDWLLYYGKRTSDGGEDAEGKHIQGDDIKMTNTMAKLSLYPSEGHKVSASFKRYADEGKYPFRPEFGYSSQDKSQINPAYSKSKEYSLGYQYDPSDDFSLKLNAYKTDRDFLLQGVRNNNKMQIKATGGVKGITAQAVQQKSHKLGDQDVQHKLVYGGEFYKKSSTSSKSQTRPKDASQAARSYSLYLEDQINLGRFQLTPGIRHDLYKTAELSGDKKFNKTSGALAGSVKLLDNLNLFASYTQFFNGTPLPETIRNGGTPYIDPERGINPDLEPETGNNKEIGFNLLQKDLIRQGDRASLTTKHFRTDFDNTTESITVNDQGKPDRGGKYTLYRNAGETTLKGYEIIGDYQYKNLTLKASYAHAKSKKANGTSLRDTGDELKLGIDYLINKNISLGASYNHTRSVTRQEIQRGSQTIADVTYPSYNTLDIYGSYTPQTLPNLKLDLGIYNLNNRHYTRHSSRSTDAEAGRNLKLTATYQF